MKIKMKNELYHFGIKGMKWGIRRYQNKDGSLTSAGKKRYSDDLEYYKTSKKQIHVNKDGSKTIPNGFVFNRVGKSDLDVNKSGSLYVSYGKEDASRYIKNLGPTPINKLFGSESTTVQHLSVKKDMKLASNEETVKKTCEILLSDKNLLKEFNESIFSFVSYNDYGDNISEKDIRSAIKNPKGKEATKIAYGFSSLLADPNYVNSAKKMYNSFRKDGYDAIPDLHDTLSGTSETATIIINPDSVSITSKTLITKEIMKSAKRYVKSMGKLKVSDLIKD